MCVFLCLWEIKSRGTHLSGKEWSSFSLQMLIRCQDAHEREIYGNNIGMFVHNDKGSSCNIFMGAIARTVHTLQNKQTQTLYQGYPISDLQSEQNNANITKLHGRVCFLKVILKSQVCNNLPRRKYSGRIFGVSARDIKATTYVQSLRLGHWNLHNQKPDPSHTLF